MKNIFKVAALALVVMGLTVACKSNNTEAVEDTTPVEEMVMDTVDSIEEVAEEIVAEEPVKTVTKKVTKKEEAQPTKSTEIKDDVSTKQLPAKNNGADRAGKAVTVKDNASDGQLPAKTNGPARAGRN